MRSVKKVLMIFALGFILVSLISCDDKNITSSFTSLTTSNIEKIEISSPRNQLAKSLNSDETAAFVKLLNNISENDIKDYNGPTIKGGPTTITIFIKSNETLVISLNGDSFIYRRGNKDYQVHQPDVRKFIDKVYYQNNVEQTKLDIIKDIEYVSLLQEGDFKGAFLDKIIFADKDKALTDKIQNSILSGTVIEDMNMFSESSNPLIIGIKQKDGNLIEGEYIDGNIIFNKPIKAVVKTNGSMESLIQDFKSRKLNTLSQDLKYLGQVRNNNIIIERTKISSFGEDPVFENFKGSNKKPSEYEQALINEAVSLGIDEKKLSNALTKAKQYKNNIKTQYPVIIDTGTYRDKACFILTFTWETLALKANQNKVQNLGHVFTAILDEDGNEVAYSTCK